MEKIKYMAEILRKYEPTVDKSAFKVRPMKHYTDFKPIKFDLHSVKKKTRYCDDIFTCDTESTTMFINEKGECEPFDYNKPPEYYKNLEKVSACYIWMFSVNEVVYYGRYLDELPQFIETIDNAIQGQKKNPFAWTIYIQNLAYDFQTLRSVLKFSKVFARQQRKPMRAELADREHVSFKCSYMLSNLSLDSLAKEEHLPVQKKTGDLDYTKPRHSLTPLTLMEEYYCYYDCVVLYHYIKKMRDEYGSINKIPMTQTGKVRLDFKKAVKANSKRPEFALNDWRKRVANLTPQPETFKQLVRCYAGGYVHANALHAGKILNNVHSFDFASSYPYVMISEKFPMSLFIKDDYATLDTLDVENYAYMLTLKFTDFVGSTPNTYISESKCTELYNCISDNGRIKSASRLTITITEQDWETIKNNHFWESVEVLEIKKSIKQYLPNAIILFILEYYRNKSQFKGSKEHEDWYNNQKARLNSIYGMAVTNYICDIIEYEGDYWTGHEIGEEEVKKELEKMKENKNILMAYQWGVWVTAYARRNLWQVIEQIGSDVVYCDTDSIKFIGDHTTAIEEYNESVTDKLRKSTQAQGIDFSTFETLYTAEGKPVTLIGKFDDEGDYLEFITLGAKKYGYKKHNPKTKEITTGMRVSGVNRKTGAEALQNDLSNFQPSFLFDYHTSGRTIHLYNDEQPYFYFCDYTGITAHVTQRCGCAIYPTTYLLGITPMYEEAIGCNLLKNL